MAVTQLQFQRELAASLHRPLWLRVPAFLLRLALGEMAQLLVDGQHVVPRRAVEAGFTFRFRQLTAALANLLGERRAGDSAAPPTAASSAASIRPVSTVRRDSGNATTR